MGILICSFFVLFFFFYEICILGVLFLHKNLSAVHVVYIFAFTLLANEKKKKKKSVHVLKRFSWRKSIVIDQKSRYDTNRGDVYELRRSFGSRFQRWTSSYPQTILHQQRLFGISSGHREPAVLQLKIMHHILFLEFSFLPRSLACPLTSNSVSE